MEILVLVGGLCALGALALLFGHDSREGFRSEEHVLAGLGYAWSGKPRARQQPSGRKPANALRHRLAVFLNGLADWLYPVGLTRNV